MKNFLIILLVFFAANVNAQETGRLKTKDFMKGESFNEAFPFLNMKAFHDREGMKDVVTHIHQIDSNSSKYNDEKIGFAKEIFSQQDAQKIETSILNFDVKHDIKGTSLDEKLQKVEQNPYGVFQEIILETSVPKTTREEVRKLNQIDNTVIPEMIEMVMEGGPVVGGGNVSVIYDSDQ